MTPLLEFRRLACVRGDRLVFEGVECRIAGGEAAVVTGPNGAGKSSLLRIAAGLLEPAAGRVIREGSLAWSGEAIALDAELPLGRALRFWAELDGADMIDVRRALHAMGIDALEEVPVRYLSTGQRRRAALARVIAGRAQIWLLDEPGNGLDPIARERLASVIGAHCDSGGITLAATHHPLGLTRATRIALGNQ